MSRKDERLLPFDEDDLFLQDESTEASGVDWLDGIETRGDEAAKMAHDKYPFGVMQDVFRFSGYNILACKRGGDRSGDHSEAAESNTFAVAKMGKPQLVKPTNMDIEVRAVSRFQTYLKQCDEYFPHLSQMEWAVVVV